LAIVAGGVSGGVGLAKFDVGEESAADDSRACLVADIGSEAMLERENNPAIRTMGMNKRCILGESNLPPLLSRRKFVLYEKWSASSAVQPSE